MDELIPWLQTYVCLYMCEAPPEVELQVKKQRHIMRYAITHGKNFIASNGLMAWGLTTHLFVSVYTNVFK